MSAKRVAATCVVLTLTACSIGQPIPSVTTYVIEPPKGDARSAAARSTETLRIGNVRVAASYARNSLVYRMSEVQYVADPYHAFIAEPGTMMANRIGEWLDGARLFKTVAQPGSAGPAAYVLDATVTELYGDFRQGRRPAAMLAVQFALLDQTGARSRVVFERTIASRVDLAEASADALVLGYGKALAEILSQLAPELSAATVREATREARR